MALINAECKLCEVILNEPSLIPVINRFGIVLGVGDKSIRTVCEEKKLDSEFFVTILNTFINEDYFPENRLKSFCAAQIVDYLTQTNAYYQQFQTALISTVAYLILTMLASWLLGRFAHRFNVKTEAVGSTSDQPVKVEE